MPVDDGALNSGPEPTDPVAPAEPVVPAPQAAVPAAHLSTAARIRAARAYYAEARLKVDDSRPRYRSLDLVMSVGEHDQVVGGGLLAGALAYRLFLWLLPASLVVVGLTGFIPIDALKRDVQSVGLGDLTATAIEQANADASRSRWVALVIGLYFLYFTSVALAKAVVAATALGWRVPIPKLENKPRAALFTSAILFGALGMSLTSTWIRHHFARPGTTLLVTAVLALVWMVLWWLVARNLPRAPGVGASQLWAGAALVGIGVQLMQLVIVVYLARRLTTASGLYGSLGGAATLLLSAYILARMIIASCALNATLAGRRGAGDPGAASEG